MKVFRIQLRKNELFVTDVERTQDQLDKMAKRGITLDEPMSRGRGRMQVIRTTDESRITEHKFTLLDFANAEITRVRKVLTAKKAKIKDIREELLNE